MLDLILYGAFMTDEKDKDVKAAYDAVKKVSERFKYVEGELERLGDGNYDGRLADQIDTELMDADAMLKWVGDYIPNDPSYKEAKEKLKNYENQLTEIKKNHTTSPRV